MHLHRAARASAVLVVTAGLVVGGLTTTAAAQERPAPTSRADRPLSADAGSGTGDQDGQRGSARVYGSPPSGVRVSTSEQGFTVYATPHCSLAKSCRTWITVPGAVDAKDVTATTGYFVPWPSGWAEGRAESAGVVRSYARDVFGNGWYSAAVGLGTIVRPIAFRSITAQLATQDDAARSAVVTGTATPGSSIRRNGVQVARADERTGTWTATATGLPAGTTDLVFQQVVDGVQRDSASVRVTLRAEAVLRGLDRRQGDLPAERDKTLHGVFQVTGPFATPVTDGTVTFTAPVGTTLAPRGSSIRGQYQLPGSSTWTDFPDVQLTGGTLGAGATRATYTWRSSAGTSLPSVALIRFGIPVHRSPLSAGSAALAVDAVGSAATGTFDATATSAVTWSVASDR